ncbi:unnamed protein product [Orchesella dallaii]|uniref:Carboxylesterase type B domain-containing protein n=1 Tax=Orchesella dallaii TaxID=48710 RepID=A0ABP1S7P6_9HEXA
MLFSIPLFAYNLFCAWFECEGGPRPPFLFLNPDNQRLLPRNPFLPRQDVSGPVAYTKLGPVRGFKMKISETREIFAFTGVPYGESTAGKNRYSNPVPRRAWKGTWDGTYPSPYCLQSSPVTMGRISGKEDCLYIDIYTPILPSISNSNYPVRNTSSPLLPVIMWSPAGMNYYGRSRFFGPKYFLKEDVILIPINVRYGSFGFLSTGDEFSPGNFGLRDHALAIQWVYENIKGFGGDPHKIVMGGLSSGGTDAHMLLFVNHPARKLLSGIIAQSGTALYTGLETEGGIRKASDKLAEAAGCPKSTKGGGNSRKMVECLRKIEPNMLLNHEIVSRGSYTFRFGPSLEPNDKSGFLARRPEEAYQRGEVPPIPMIISRTSREAHAFLGMSRIATAPILSIPGLYDTIFPQVFRLMDSAKGKNVTEEEAKRSLKILNKVYFNKTTSPNLINGREWDGFCEMLTDAGYTTPMWKGIELHHKIGNTYAYLLSLPADVNQIARRTVTYKGEACHSTDYIFLFNNSRLFPTHQPGSKLEKASSRLINMLVNFATYGTPYYRHSNGKLLNIWKPVRDMRDPVALDVGLVNGIKMKRDPVAVSNRWRIWDYVRF